MAVLYDLETGALLYEKNADASIPPASMTKLMSLHLAYEAIASGELSKEQLIPISPEASFQACPPRSSLIFLEAGHRVTLLDLIIALALPSGNDAGVALARAVAGSMSAFVEKMNSEARRLGLTKTRFVDYFGYSAENLTTPREENIPRGGLVRAMDATSLLSYDFYASRTFAPEAPALPQRRIYRGERNHLRPFHEALR